MPATDTDSVLAAWTAHGVVLTVLMIAAAAGVHWALHRAGRRVAVALARRARATENATEIATRWRRTVERVLLLPMAALWVAVGYGVSEQFPLLRQWRLLVVCLVQESFTEPLFKMGEMSYSALDIMLLPALIVAIWVGMGIGTHLVRLVFFRASAMQEGAQQALGVLTRVLLTFIGTIVVFQYWGVDLSSLAVLGGALGVGIGFGLQTIANNFVSGIVLGLERPIKPGDYVRVGDLVGTVARIGARSTEIRTADRVSILVPNSRLLEHEVVNWTHGDPISRIHLPLGVAYGSDLRQVRAALLEAARSHPDVLADPRPDVQLHGFGESSLDVELLVWTRDPRNQVQLTSDLYFRIEPLLRRHGIAVPFPQHDLHLHAPEIERAAAVWRRQVFPESEPEPQAAAPPAPVGHLEPCVHDHEQELGTPSWDDERLAALVARMRGDDGITIADRRHFLRVHARCFVGSDAVDWLVHHERLTRDEAVALGRRLVERGLVHHVLDEHEFKDGPLFYRFRADEEPTEARSRARAPSVSRRAAAGI
ncbi:MAG: mechanosensitive ion channel [Deltaproteobacteria bacterium]|nr:mechanosensitive ion channel [Deltaproteobacteria bacterium]